LPTQVLVLQIVGRLEEYIMEKATEGSEAFWRKCGRDRCIGYFREIGIEVTTRLFVWLPINVAFNLCSMRDL
jgi:hypothetical protein